MRNTVLLSLSFAQDGGEPDKCERFFRICFLCVSARMLRCLTPYIVSLAARSAPCFVGEQTRRALSSAADVRFSQSALRRNFSGIGLLQPSAKEFDVLVRFSHGTLAFLRDFWLTADLTVAAVMQLARLAPRLETISAIGCKPDAATALVDLIRSSGTALRHVALSSIRDPTIRRSLLTAIVMCLRPGAVETLMLPDSRAFDTEAVCFAIEKLGVGLVHLSLNELIQVAPQVCVDAVARHCPRLQVLEFTYSAKGQEVEPLDFAALSTSCPQLRFVDLGSRTDVSDAGLEQLCRNCTSLQGLDLLSCDQLTTAGMQQISLARGLRSLHLAGYWNHSAGINIDSVIEVLSANLELLETLHLFFNASFSSVGLTHIARNCRALQFLDCSVCDVDAGGFAFFTANAVCAPTLRHLDVTNVRGTVPGSAVRKLLERFPRFVSLCLGSSCLLANEDLRAQLKKEFAAKSVEIRI